MDRKALVREALQAATELRDALDLDQFGPVDPYASAAELGVKVVFLGASMEGFYFKGPPPRILLSSARPVPRRAFTCAHELGHHWFGHGTTIDQLQEDDRPDDSKPEEVLANGLAAFFLMPTPGLRGAFSRRGWMIGGPSPIELFAVACEFGVGYRTLLNHLTYALNEISPAHRGELIKWTPQRMRRELLDTEFPSFSVVDAHSEAAATEVEKGAAVLLPSGASASGDTLTHVQSTADHEVYRAHRRGRAAVTGMGRPFEVRVMPTNYVGPASNRFLEDPDEEE